MLEEYGLKNRMALAINRLVLSLWLPVIITGLYFWKDDGNIDTRFITMVYSSQLYGEIVGYILGLPALLFLSFLMKRIAACGYGYSFEKYTFPKQLEPGENRSGRERIKRAQVYLAGIEADTLLFGICLIIYHYTKAIFFRSFPIMMLPVLLIWMSVYLTDVGQAVNELINTKIATELVDRTDEESDVIRTRGNGEQEKWHISRTWYSFRRKITDIYDMIDGKHSDGFSCVLEKVIWGFFKTTFMMISVLYPIILAVAVIVYAGVNR